ncbi:NAD(P)/FAD-dependent oxidoreductase [Streptomyces sp. NPDC057877]|uniref:NAD(P)/FAD-dependent oxidoreductase n=1 Tax=Streptomyces sp. NPDC057877 TaxID=3346269 RepID=UPI0036835F8F
MSRARVHAARFRAHAASVEKVRTLGVEIVTDCEVSRLIGADRVERAEIRHRVTKETRLVPAGTVVAALGFLADLGPLQHWGLDLQARKITVDTHMATNLPRVFAAGDITDHPGKVRLISVGFGEAATAVNNAATVIDPEADLFAPLLPRSVGYRQPALNDVLLQTYPHSQRLMGVCRVGSEANEELNAAARATGALRPEFTAGGLHGLVVDNTLAFRHGTRPPRDYHDRRTMYLLDGIRGSSAASG